MSETIQILLLIGVPLLWGLAADFVFEWIRRSGSRAEISQRGGPHDG